MPLSIIRYDAKCLRVCVSVCVRMYALMLRANHTHTHEEQAHTHTHIHTYMHLHTHAYVVSNDCTNYCFTQIVVTGSGPGGGARAEDRGDLQKHFLFTHFKTDFHAHTHTHTHLLSWLTLGINA